MKYDRKKEDIKAPLIPIPSAAKTLGATAESVARPPPPDSGIVLEYVHG